jgi:protein phosphatase
VDAWEAPAAAGDRYLVCSDGLFNEVDDGQIAAVLTGTEDPQYAADTLIELANAAGGRDNISVVVVDVVATPAPTAPSLPAEVDDHDEHEPPATADAADVVETPVALASPDGSPPVGGWVDPDAAPTDTSPVPIPVRPPDLPPPAMAEPKQRRVTWRSVLFVVAILAILGIAFGAITYYGRSGYYVGFVGDQVAVFKGQKGGVLWVKPTLDGTYDLHRADLTPAWQQRLDDTITFTSRASADAWFETLRANPAAVPGLAPSTTIALTPTTAVPTTAPLSTELTPTTAAGP